MIVSARRGLVGLAALTATVLVCCAGCSSSAKRSGSSSGPSGADPSGSSHPAASPTSPSDGAGAPTADPATLKAVSSAFATFFSATASTAVAESLLQHGSAFAQVLIEQGKSSYADNASATVTGVRVSGPLAYVDFTVSSSGIKLPIKGYAVNEAGQWKVAATTFCSLLTLEGSAPSQCRDAAITALPR